MRRIRHILLHGTIPALALTVTACGGGQSQSDAPALPKAVALSPDGARYVFHSFSPDGKHIAYWTPSEDQANRMQLWVANADLTQPAKIAVTALAVFPAQWSPDGSLLAAGSGDYGTAQVVLVPLSGGSIRRVTQGAAVTFPMTWFRHGEALNYYGTTPGGGLQSFVYEMASGQSRPLVPAEKRSNLGVASPDGSHVAYFVIDGSKTTIWVADGDGSHPRQLTTEGFEGLVQYQEWSPDSKELLYESTRTGHSDLWVLPIDGGPARQLTHDVRDDFAGAWSPDGRWIAFLSNRGRQTDVWVVPSAGGPELRVTDTPAEEQSPLVWRPTGHTLTFGVRTEEDGVWALDLAGATERRLTPESQRVMLFRLSPDGTQILYVVQKGGGIQDLVVSPTTGGDARVLVEGGGTVEEPQWSPNNKTIAFTSDRGGSRDIWMVDAAPTPALRQVTTWPGSEGQPHWNRDGSQVFFNADKDTRLNDIWRVAATGGEPVRVTTAGNLGNFRGIAGQDGFFVSTIAKAGQLAVLRMTPDGRLSVVWDKSTVLPNDPAPMVGDSLVADVEQPDGKMQSMFLAADGHGGRLILKPGETAVAASKDGQWIVYQLAAGGATDLGLLRVADGTTRRLTTTHESEEGAEFTPDGKTILFRRVKTVQRITAVDLSSLLNSK
jgi:TolB protein